MKNAMRLTWMFRSAVLVLFLVMPGPASGLQINVEKWSEDALLHDGRIIKIMRRVDSTLQTGVHAYFLFPKPYMKSRPDRFWFSFEHPDSQKRISWQGEQNVYPVMLDIVDEIPYLVVKWPVYRDGSKKIINHDEFPYKFFRYESGFSGEWIEIPSEQFPSILRDANLSPVYPNFSRIIPDGKEQAAIELKRGRPFRDLSPDEVIKNIKKVEKSSQRNFQSKIPKSYEKWFNNKNIRPPRQTRPNDGLPLPQEVVVEILKTKDYVPERVMNAQEWPCKGGDDECSESIKWVNPKDESLDECFINYPTEQKQIPYGKWDPAQVVRICEGDYIWFISHHGKISITKYTTSGDLLYHIGFQIPEEINGFKRELCPSFFRSEKGYLYFNWKYVGYTRTEWLIKRDLETRILEPNPIKSPIVTIECKPGQALQDRKQKTTLPRSMPQTAVKSFKDCQTCPEMVMIPEKNYAIGKYEVTQAEWYAVMSKSENNAWTTPGYDRPVINIDWEQVQQYITKLNQITGKNYRLPTESEWEHACYGGNQTDYCGGDDLEAVAWWGEEGLHSVGQKQPNGYGLYDMNGNVWEWVNDCWKGNCEIRVIRGGSYLEYTLRVPEAYIHAKKSAGSDVGFRLFLSVSSDAE